MFHEHLPDRRMQRCTTHRTSVQNVGPTVDLGRGCGLSRLCRSLIVRRYHPSSWLVPIQHLAGSVSTHGNPLKIRSESGLVLATIRTHTQRLSPPLPRDFRHPLSTGCWRRPGKRSTARVMTRVSTRTLGNDKKSGYSRCSYRRYEVC